MPVTVQFGERVAVIEKLKWRSEDRRLAAILNSLLDPQGPSGADPHPDYTAALEAAKLLHGKIVDFDKPKPMPEGAIR